jgi:hypothetical protein
MNHRRRLRRSLSDKSSWPGSVPWVFRPLTRSVGIHFIRRWRKRRGSPGQAGTSPVMTTKLASYPLSAPGHSEPDSHEGQGEPRCRSRRVFQNGLLRLLIWARWRLPRAGTTFFVRNYRPRLLLAEIVQSRQIRLRDLRPHRCDAKGRVVLPFCRWITQGPIIDPIDIQKVFGARRQLE